MALTVLLMVLTAVVFVPTAHMNEVGTSEPEPEFGDVIKNVTVALGREAILSCIVDNLGDYKVSVMICISVCFCVCFSLVVFFFLFHLILFFISLLCDLFPIIFCLSSYLSLYFPFMSFLVSFLDSLTSSPSFFLGCFLV